MPRRASEADLAPVSRFFCWPATDFDQLLADAGAVELWEATEPLRGVQVALDYLVPSQPTVSLDRVGELLADALSVTRIGSQFVLVDGHHHAVAAMLRGETHARAELVHLDALLARLR